MTFAESTGGAGNAVGLLFGFLMFGAIYLLPTIVAFVRTVPNRGSVVVVNVFLGWTVVGWVVALAMAARSRPSAPAQVTVYANSTMNASTVTAGQALAVHPAVSDGRE